MTTTQADSTAVLGMPPDRVEPPAAGAPCYVLATDLKPGDMIRDRGALHTIEQIDDDPRPQGCLTIIMEDGGRLGVPRHQHLYAWQPGSRG